MSFKDDWKKFSTEDKRSVAFWGANALLWGGMTVGGLVAAVAPALAPSALVAQYCGGPFIGFLGMSMAALSAHSSAKLNSELNRNPKASLAALKDIADSSKTKFRDKWRELPKKKKFEILLSSGFAALTGGLAISAAATGLPAYLACSYAACAIGYAVSASTEYENTQKEKQLASLGKSSVLVQTTQKTRSRQKIDEKNMQPQTLETVKDRMTNKQKQKTTDDTKSVEVNNIIKLAKKKYTQESK